MSINENINPRYIDVKCVCLQAGYQ